MPSLGSGIVFGWVPRDDMGYQVVDGVGDAVGSHGCIVALCHDESL